MRILFIISLLIHSALGFVPADNYLVDCGSKSNNTVEGRTFSADDLRADVLSTSRTIHAEASLSYSVSSDYGSSLFLTARIFESASSYKFPIREKGRHLVRLYFSPFLFENYDLGKAEFSVSAQNITLLRNFRIQSGAAVKEYSFNVTTSQIVLTLAPKSGSFAFLNALEITSLPSEVIPAGAGSMDAPKTTYRNFQDRCLETVARVNMGNRTVPPRNDSLWRLWINDGEYLKQNKVIFESRPQSISYKEGWPSENVAPAAVYGTATRSDSVVDPNFNANITWLFRVDPGFEYFMRFHFCDVLELDYSSMRPFQFHVFVNSRFAYIGLNVDNLTGQGAPYYFDVVASPTHRGELNVSLGPSTEGGRYPMMFLSGLEIMKLSNSKASLHVSDAAVTSSRNPQTKVGVICLVGGVLIAAIGIVLAIFLICRKRRKQTTVGQSKEEGHFHDDDNTMIISSSKIGYKFPFCVIEEATDKFRESLIIGVGGFGKVYKGVLRDGTMVAVKRGSSRSTQGLMEFRTEVEMLSQFRHRHLVSLIGYCDDMDEMIIIYEFMENGTVKNHLYGSDLPPLTWRQRLEICIGAAKGLHYLHTGPAKAIIHRDVKTANILLDENLMAKVADFGISRAGPDLNETHVSTAIRGSFGYLDPEYLTRQQLTEKSDVYSFGVVMLEIISGRPVIDQSRPSEEVILVQWAMELQKSGKLHQIVDPQITSEMKEGSLLKFVEVAGKCLAELGADRPSMGDVLWNLEAALQLEGKGMEQENPIQNSRSFLSAVSRSEISSTADFSLGSMKDLDGVSLSKVFAKMVKEEMR
ncbi:hypothetical protein SAY87_006909 [Trapa incisa]|uniref:Protein kinase domain-containing protein n=1 Tax=Trapa incisa TaxID=236973 RepID=A0AAN7PZC3_9MYRT|nr:hypothetical protein SAY87_006909 [Trapa incisa]